MKKDSKMFCLWCCDSNNLKQPNSTSSFATTGCTNFNIGALRSHDISTSHHDVVKACFAKKQPAAAPLARALQIVSEEVQNKVKTLFCTKITTYANLCGLEAKHGVELGNTYRNDKAR